MGSYDSMIANFDAVEKLGRAIAQSQLFGCSSVDQGVVIATECFLNDQSPLDYAKRNKLMQGKQFQQYDSMLAGFHERGGKSKIESKTPDLASITLTYDGQTKTFSLTWEEAQKETFPYQGKEAEIVATLQAGKQPALKPKYATPRSRAIMLFARVVSDSIRSMCPEVNYGQYTAEEIEDIPSGEAVRPAREVAKPVAVEPEPAATAAPSTISEPPYEHYTHPVQRDTDPITDSLIKDIQQKLQEIRQFDATITDKLKEWLASKGLKIRELTVKEGETLLAALGEKNVRAFFDASLRKGLASQAAASPT